MEDNAKSIKQHYMVYYARMLLEDKLKTYYSHPEYTFSVKTDSQSILGFTPRYLDLNKEMIDFNYVFSYKNTVKDVCDQIINYIKLNSSYLNKLQLNEVGPDKLFSLNNDLYTEALIIKDKFKVINLESKITDYYHLGPQFYFFKECLNCHKSAQSIYNLYKQRIYDKKIILKKVNQKFTNMNLYYDALVTQIGSTKENFLKIIDVYGDCRLLKMEKSELIGLDVNDFQPKYRKTNHTKQVTNFLNNPVSNLVTQILTNKMVQIPGTSKLFRSNIAIKIVPDFRIGFNFVVSMKYLFNKNRTFMILNSDLLFDSYTENLTFMFAGLESGIKTGGHISEISGYICNVIQEAINKNPTKQNSSNEIFKQQMNKMKNTALNNRGNVGGSDHTPSSGTTIGNKSPGTNFENSPISSVENSQQVLSQQLINNKKKKMNRGKSTISDKSEPIKREKMEFGLFVASVKLTNIDETQTSETIFLVKINHIIEQGGSFEIFEIELTKFENMQYNQNNENSQEIEQPEGFQFPANQSGFSGFLNKRGSQRYDLGGFNQNTNAGGIHNISECSEGTEKMLALEEGKKKSKRIVEAVAKKVKNLQDSGMDKTPKSSNEAVIFMSQRASKQEDQSSLMFNGNISMQKRYYAFEEALKVKVGFYQLLIMLIIWIISAVIYFCLFQFVCERY